jgi:hypothetical protein
VLKRKLAIGRIKGKNSRMNTQSKRKKAILFTSSLFLAFFIQVVSCGKQRAEWTGTIEEVAGVSVVKNPNAPLHSVDILILEEELTIGETEGREESAFFQLRDVDADESGRIFTLDSKEANVKVFDQDGHHLRTIGGRGQGPGEFQIPNDIFVDDKNRIYISDVGNDRLSVFEEDGDFADSFNFTEYSITEITGVNRKGEIILLMNRTSKESSEHFLAFDYVVDVYSARFEFLERLYRATIPVMQGFAKQGKMLSLSIPYQEKLCCAMDSRDHVYVAESEEYAVRVLASDGKLIGRIEKAHERSEVSRRDIKNLIRENFQDDEIETIFWLETVEKQLRCPRYKPVFDKLYSDQDKLLVLRQEGGEGKHFFADVFDPTGKYIGITQLEVLPRAWKNNRIYTIEEDESGFQCVKRYKVHWEI